MELLHHAERRLIATVARRPSTSLLRVLSSVDLPAPSPAAGGHDETQALGLGGRLGQGGAPGGTLIAGGLEGEEEAIERRWREMEQGEEGGPALFCGAEDEEGGDEEGDWGQSVHF